MADEDLKETIRRFNACITAGDINGLAEMLTDDHKFIDASGMEIIGRQQVIEAWTGFFAAFPGYENVFEETIAVGAGLNLRGYSTCDDPRLDGPALWRGEGGHGKLHLWQVFEDNTGNRIKLGFA